MARRVLEKHTGCDMKTKQTIPAEPCEKTFRVTSPDQQGGIFSHDDQAVSIKYNEPRSKDTIYPVLKR